MRVEIDPAAQQEAVDLVSWYERRDRQVAEQLAELFIAAIVQVARQPLTFPLMEGAEHLRNVRRVRLRGFPIVVIFQVRDDEAYVIAVAHTSRQPGYWTSRLTDR